MAEERWLAVDHYIEEALVHEDDALRRARRRSEEEGLPPIAVAPNQGKLLQLLARVLGARRILEIGTLGGYSTIWLARGLAEGGRLVSLELDPHHAEVARDNLEAAGLADRAEVRVGRALDSLEGLEDEGFGPVDLAFIDADKPSNPDYFSWALRLARPGSVIVVDNVVRNGLVAEERDDPAVRGVRRLNEIMGSERRVSATALQTVGVKGYDGLAVALVVSD